MEKQTRVTWDLWQRSKYFFHDWLDPWEESAFAVFGTLWCSHLKNLTSFYASFSIFLLCVSQCMFRNEHLLHFSIKFHFKINTNEAMQSALVAYALTVSVQVFNCFDHVSLHFCLWVRSYFPASQMGGKHPQICFAVLWMTCRCAFTLPCIHLQVSPPSQLYADHRPCWPI